MAKSRGASRSRHSQGAQSVSSPDARRMSAPSDSLYDMASSDPVLSQPVAMTPRVNRQRLTPLATREVQRAMARGPYGYSFTTFQLSKFYAQHSVWKDRQRLLRAHSALRQADEVARRANVPAQQLHRPSLVKALVCAKRKIRREVLFSFKRNGRGGGRKFLRFFSNVRC